MPDHKPFWTYDPKTDPNWGGLFEGMLHGGGDPAYYLSLGPKPEAKAEKKPAVKTAALGFRPK